MSCPPSVLYPGYLFNNFEETMESFDHLGYSQHVELLTKLDESQGCLALTSALCTSSPFL
jgi:hypothetical protein